MFATMQTSMSSSVIYRNRIVLSQLKILAHMVDFLQARSWDTIIECTTFIPQSRWVTVVKFVMCHVQMCYNFDWNVLQEWIKLCYTVTYFDKLQ